METIAAVLRRGPEQAAERAHVLDPPFSQCMHVFDLWKEARAPAENSAYRHRQTFALKSLRFSFPWLSCSCHWYANGGWMSIYERVYACEYSVVFLENLIETQSVSVSVSLEKSFLLFCPLFTRRLCRSVPISLWEPRHSYSCVLESPLPSHWGQLLSLDDGCVTDGITATVNEPLYEWQGLFSDWHDEDKHGKWHLAYEKEALFPAPSERRFY